MARRESRCILENAALILSLIEGLGLPVFFAANWITYLSFGCTGAPVGDAALPYLWDRGREESHPISKEPTEGIEPPTY